MQKWSFLPPIGQKLYFYYQESFCKAPDSAAKQRDFYHFVGDATGIMPIYIVMI